MKDFVALRQSKYCQPQCTVLTVKVPFGQFRISSRENERNKLALLTVNVGPYTDPALSHPVSAAFQACGSEIQVHIAYFRMDGIHRQLLQEATKGDVVGPFFGFMGAAAALIFACKLCRCSIKPYNYRNLCVEVNCTRFPLISQCWTRDGSTFLAISDWLGFRRHL